MTLAEAMAWIVVGGALYLVASALLGRGMKDEALVVVVVAAVVLALVRLLA